MTTHGWDLLCLMSDDSTAWISLKNLKESHPLEVAEYAISNGIDTEPAFCLWTSYTLRKRDRIIPAVKSRIAKVYHKNGVEIPTYVSHAYDIDRANNNALWRDAIDKEMGNLKVAFATP